MWVNASFAVENLESDITASVAKGWSVPNVVVNLSILIAVVDMATVDEGIVTSEDKSKG